MYSRRCEGCGVPFLSDTANKILCPECARFRKLESRRKAMCKIRGTRYVPIYRALKGGEWVYEAKRWTQVRSVRSDDGPDRGVSGE